MKIKPLSKENRTLLCITVCTVLPYLASYASMPGVSILAGCCLFALCAAVCAAVPGSAALKIGIPALVSGIVSAIMIGNTLHAIMTGLLMAFMCASFLLAYRMRGKKIFYKLLTAALALMMFPLNTIFCGFITGTLDAQKRLDEYTASKYGKNSVISNIYYDHTAGIYKCDAYSKSTPTEVHEIIIKNGAVKDLYLDSVKGKLLEAKAQEITSALREAFPDGRFAVSGRNMPGYPTGIADPDTEDDLGEMMVLEVKIRGMMDLEEFAEEAQKYADALYASGISFHRIILIGGNGQHDLFSVSIRNTHLLSRISVERIKPISRMKYVKSDLY